MTPEPDLIAIAETIDKATPGPWAFIQTGGIKGECLLWGEHSDRPIVLDAERRGFNGATLRANQDGIMVALDRLKDGYSHPDLVAICAARNLAPAALRWADAEIKRLKSEIDKYNALRGEHDCGCEVCSKTSAVCPASASSYAMRIVEQAATNAAQAAEIDGLRRAGKSALMELQKYETVSHAEGMRAADACHSMREALKKGTKP